MGAILLRGAAIASHSNSTDRGRTMLTVAITGATGAQGGATARALLTAGHHVRALTRHPDAPPARTLLGRGGGGG
ncbi:NmrA family NAD(P)-binding protein, partial [Streptomyces sp. 1222.5]|uniref:NmrA family NAD(P)-binding protein n=1 Tax=Streptomyces sp. 1222.5 TaxID=1881026 RepID=UPI003EC0C446